MIKTIGSFAAGFIAGIAFAIWWSGYDQPESWPRPDTPEEYARKV